MQLDEPIECMSGGDPLLLYKILYLLFFPLVQILCALPLRVEKKLATLSWCVWNLFLWSRRCLTNPFRTLPFCFGVIGRTPGLISHNNFVKKMFVCIGHRNNVLARCDSIFPLLRCQGAWNKTHTQLSLSESLELQSWGCSKILLSFLMQFGSHFWPNQQQQQCSPQFELILDGHRSCHLLPAPFHLEIENTT